jgi:hypothetical protein
MVDIDYKIKQYITVLRDPKYHVYFKHREDWKWTRILDVEFNLYKEALGYVTKLQNGEPEPSTSRPISWTVPNGFGGQVYVGSGGGGGAATTPRTVDGLKAEIASLNSTVEYQAEVIRGLRDEIRDLKRWD